MPVVRTTECLCQRIEPGDEELCLEFFHDESATVTCKICIKKTELGKTNSGNARGFTQKYDDIIRKHNLS